MTKTTDSYLILALVLLFLLIPLTAPIFSLLFFYVLYCIVSLISHSPSFCPSVPFSCISQHPVICLHLSSSLLFLDHVVNIHQAAFMRLRSIINTMLTGEETPPPFMRAACPGNVLPIHMELNSNLTDTI